jgi:hypothetical protein
MLAADGALAPMRQSDAVQLVFRKIGADVASDNITRLRIPAGSERVPAVKSRCY